LSRLYRRRAQELHPDKGGDHETFLRLTAAYHKLLRVKK
jgi:predicted 2-oxoglutarate/Fe(II)-dependent dioxygenase YbiX